jgi:3-(3-hydroxy-phenyl)propionate hydroxylase
MTAPAVRRTSVAVVGGGPNGITTANLLGAYGIHTVVIERETAILEYPRAVGMDDEALRLFQSVDLAEPLLRDMIQNVPMRMFRASGACFAHIQPATREFGWWRRNIFMQQLAEKTLRQGLTRYRSVELRLGEEVIGLSQNARAVTLQVRDSSGNVYALEADYCVAADGGRSPLRDMLGVRLCGKTHPIKWLVLDAKNANVDAPYTALYCDPRRPHVCVYLPYGFRRWEFLVYPHEDAQAIASPDSVRRLLKHHVADPEKVEVVRARTYTHHSRVADRFVIGRVALVGDAAHLTPPWIGQGLNAGLRDAGNIAWKLAGIVNGRLQPSVLASYEQERRDHAWAMIDLADTFGALLMPTSRIKAGLRDAFFSAVRLLPGVRDYVLQMRFKPMPAYREGVVVHLGTSAAVGRMFIQPDVADDTGKRRKLDDVLGPWFAVVGWQVDPQQEMSPEDRAFWRDLGARFVQVHRSRSGTAPGLHVGGMTGTICVEDIDNLFADWIAAHPGAILVLRPDRYIAAHAEPERLRQITEHVRAFVPARPNNQRTVA